LRYEFDAYQGFEQELPPVNAQVDTERGRGKVLALELLARKVVVELADRRRVVLGPEEILSVESSRPRRRGEAPPGDDDRVE
jgi:cell fate regulator YaaT (PSP1 superfamily)